MTGYGIIGVKRQINHSSTTKIKFMWNSSFGTFQLKSSPWNITSLLGLQRVDLINVYNMIILNTVP
jgi:hypothetical protein